MDKIDIYNKLVGIKPFFKIPKSKKIIQTHNEVTLVKGSGQVYFESTVSGGNALRTKVVTFAYDI